MTGFFFSVPTVQSALKHIVIADDVPAARLLESLLRTYVTVEDSNRFAIVLGCRHSAWLAKLATPDALRAVQTALSTALGAPIGLVYAHTAESAGGQWDVEAMMGDASAEPTFEELFALVQEQSDRWLRSLAAHGFQMTVIDPATVESGYGAVPHEHRWVTSVTQNRLSGYWSSPVRHYEHDNEFVIMDEDVFCSDCGAKAGEEPA